MGEQNKYESRNDALLAMLADSTSAFTELREEKHIELYSKQFDWTTRYAGKDNVLGDANFKLIDYNLSGDTVQFLNPLGLVSGETVKLHLKRIDERVAALNEKLMDSSSLYIPD